MQTHTCLYMIKRSKEGRGGGRNSKTNDSSEKEKMGYILVDHWIIRMSLSQGQFVRGLVGPHGEDDFVRQTHSGSLA